MMTKTSLTLYRGKGCGHCNNNGYLGRVGVYEIMEIKRAHRDAINNSRDTDKIRDIAIDNGMVTLEEQGKKLVFEGTTTVTELATITLLVDV